MQVTEQLKHDDATDGAVVVRNPESYAQLC